MIDHRELLKKYIMFIRDWQCCAGYPVHYPTTSGDHPMLTEEEQEELIAVVNEAFDEQNAQFYNKPHKKHEAQRT